MSKIPSKQIEFDSTLQSIADSTATGVIQRNANESVTLLPVGVTGAASLAAADAEAGRTAIGCGTLATQNSNTVTLASTVAGQTAKLRLFGAAPFGNDPNNGIVFGLSANLPSNRQLQIYSSDDPPSTGVGLRVAFTGSAAILDAVSPDASTRGDMAFGSTATGVGFGGYAPLSSVVAQFYGQTGKDIVRFELPGPTFGQVMKISNAGLIVGSTGAATVSQILTATKTAVGTNPETISVTGAAVGDVAWVSEAVPAKVTAPNTVSFNGTGLSGTIRAVVMRVQ